MQQTIPWHSVYSADVTPIVGRKRWDPQVKFLAKEAFKGHIKNKRAPKKDECLKFIKKYNVTNRTWKDVKNLIYNEYKKKTNQIV